VVQPGIVTGFLGRNGAGTGAVWADALFVSALQRSDNPSTGQVRKAIAAAVRAHGRRGCAERVAQEFGDHPETAVARMRWARIAADEVFASPAGPARDPDVVRAKALAHAWPTSSSRTNRAHLADTMHPGQIGTARTRA